METYKNSLAHCVSVDTETTGTDNNVHAMVSIGAVNFNDETDVFYRELVVPKWAAFDPEALGVNGETEASLRARTSPEFSDPTHAILEFVNWCKSRDISVILGKNPAFDYRFLLSAWERTRLPLDIFKDAISYNVIDWSACAVPLLLYRGVAIPRTGLSSLSLSRLLCFADEARPHNALNGARYNVTAMRHIMGLYMENSN